MKALIFDMDGVIIDSEPIHFEVDLQTIKELGCNITIGELEKYVGTTNEFMYSDIKMRYKIEKPLKNIINYKIELTKKKILEMQIEPIDGIRSLLTELKNKKIPTAIASSSPRNFIDLVVRKFELQEYISYIVSGDDVKNGKPSPDIYLATASKLNIPPTNCIVIEDSKNGVIAAKAAGMNCIGFQNVNSGNQDLSQADSIVYSIKDIKI